jgi:predicted nucleic acid-binding protein
MRWYIDASIALHALLPGGDSRARQWIDDVIASGDEIYSSTLLQLELLRVLRREGLDVGLARPLLDRVNLVSIDDGILRVAGTIEAHVKSLDAIHLATAAMLGSGVILATHDENMRAVAAGLGLDVTDPLAS